MPQLAQNFAPGASGESHFEHFFGSIEVPHCEQNFAPAVTWFWQFGQATVAACGEGAGVPQLTQNFAPTGFCV